MKLFLFGMLAGLILGAVAHHFDLKNLGKLK